MSKRRTREKKSAKPQQPAKPDEISVGRRFAQPYAKARLLFDHLHSYREWNMVGQYEVPGIGIKTEDVHRLFKEFGQLESGAMGQYKGTGLGLALTRKFVESQGGEIGVESEVGKGSSFTVVLPLVAAKVNV
jgi:light-regulated signal transduction histidine kinase (bacteriophytochrome)